MFDAISRLNTALEGRYGVERELGEGGMATVYLAEDLKHHRRVALKVLKPELAAVVGGERFLAEIETTANLQHPHILPLFDSGEADGFLFYVMPYVEGETLRERLDREGQLPVQEAVDIVVAAANALQAAHEEGVIHRDVKPANILLSRGQPVVADFGIALAVTAAGGGRLTETGLSLGSPYYMSPEQATADRDPSPATDVYALGCVLYEMLVGEPPYVGASAQAVLAKIITEVPKAPTAVRSTIPPNVDAAIRRALEKLPADRFATAEGFAGALKDPGFRHGALAVDAPDARRWKRVAVAATGLAVGFAALAAWGLARPTSDAGARVARLSLGLPEEQRPAGARFFDLSADGSLVVYAGPAGEGGTQLWSRRLDALEATPVPGTEGAGGGTFAISPDRLELALQSGPTIRIVPLQGGVSRTVLDSARCCVRWGPAGEWIYFNTRSLGLSRVPADGGPAEVVTRPDTAAGFGVNIFVDVLPGGDAAVYQASGPEGARIEVVDLGTGETKALVEGLFPRLSATGHLLFSDLEESALFAAPFDEERLELTGPPVPIAEGLSRPVNGWHYYAVSQEGTLLYARGGAQQLMTAVWVDRDGSVGTIDPDWTFDPGGNNRGLALSPDGTRLAVGIVEDGPEDIWIKELPRGPLSRLTYDGAQDVRPRWTPDGDAVTFISERSGDNADVYAKSADGTGEAELLVDAGLPLWEGLHSPDGEWLVVRTGGQLGQAGGRDVWTLAVGVDGAPEPLIVTSFDEKAIALSPDGRWLAYESDETGRDEIYVRPFPDVEGGKSLVSSGGGVMPVWAHSGRELFYVNGDREMVAAQVSPGEVFRVEERRVLFSIGPDLFIPAGEQYTLYDVSPDDERFVMMASAAAEQESELIVVQNWARGLRARAGN